MANLRQSAPPSMVNPTASAQMNGTGSKGLRTVTFMPPERWVKADVGSDSPTRTAGTSDWSYLGPITGLEDDGDVTGTLLTPSSLTPARVRQTPTPTKVQQSPGTVSAPLSAFRPRSRTMTFASPVASVGSPQLMANGAVSMQLTSMLRASGSPGAASVFSSPAGVRSMPSTPATAGRPSMPSTPGVPSMPSMSEMTAAVDDQVFRVGTATFPAAAFRMPRAQSHELPASQDAASMTAAPVPAKRERLKRRYKTVDLGAHLNPDVKVMVVAPGGGTVMNGIVYQKLGQKDGISLEIVGQSRSPYDRYTEAWGPPSGGPPPNLESFALDLLKQGVLGRCDCLVVGSRGGQVCLPTFWRAAGAQVPPAVVLNGGCAMQLPIQVPWPDSAVTFLVLGGQDYFRQQFSLDQYLADARSRVPRNNTTTAIMLVHEMAHMPQTQLLDAILHSLIKAVTSWKEDPQAIPTEEFEHIVAVVTAFGFHGKLIYKTGPGDAWHETSIPDIVTEPTRNRPHAHATAMTRAAPIYCD
mmetsp:Transcript_11201/g.21090  ORF Transcript_11201/g.21090 Transcript_11201/m.21090 type:complete len:525 (+) Transcript_11201:65-1639(+)